MDNSKFNSINSKEDLYKLSDYELIELFEKHNFSLEAIDISYGLPKDSSRKYYKKRNIDYKELKRVHDDSIRLEYYKNPKTCKFCGKVIPYEKRENEFCDRSCSASYVNSNSPGKYKSIKEKWKRKSLGKQKRDRTKTHNKLIDTKYSNLGLVHINPKCCIVCGQPNCTNPFCKEHSFIQLISGLPRIGFDASSIGTTRVFSEFQRVKDLLYQQYWVDGLSLTDLQSIYHIENFSSVRNILNILGIPRRLKSESITNSYLKGKHLNNDIKTGFRKHSHQDYHKTWEEKEVFLRSSYELDYATFLDENKIQYEVEILRIPYYDSYLQRDRVAIPDFYLPGTNEIVEIKSDFTLDIQEMLDKFDAYKKLGYTPKLILEHEEIDLYNIENLILSERLDKIKNKNIKRLRQKE